MQRETDKRITYLATTFLVLGLIVVGKLFILQVIQHNYYSTLALSSRELLSELNPKRGKILYSDCRTNIEYPAAINRQYYQIYAVPKDILAVDIMSSTEFLAPLLQMTSTEAKADIITKLSKTGDPYEPLAKKIPEDVKEYIASSSLKGIGWNAEDYRYYPEKDLAGPIIGFARQSNNTLVGSYGLEGYWEKTLAGQPGFVMGETGALGGWISNAGLTRRDAEEGADIVTTIDRALETEACTALKEGMKEHEATSASLVAMDPKTGAILAMCSFPDFDPNQYSNTSNLRAFNNNVIFTSYEPGSVFKPLTMALALDYELVNPNTLFTDPCTRSIDGFTIGNALKKCYGTVTMTGVLENSINTGMIWVEEKLGRERFYNGVKKFGFGENTGVELDTEVPGNISSLEKKGAIYGANGSFGQGITVTPLQLAVAYSAIANEGKLPFPRIVSEIRHPDGRIEKIAPRTTEEVISPRAAKLTTSMLMSVVENHYPALRLPRYYIAGKTGTGQISGVGGYTEDTNHTFAGFAPAKNPAIVLIVRYEKPNKPWAESTAGPTFQRVMGFALNYLGLPPEK